MSEPNEVRFACIGCGAMNPAGAEVCSGCGHRFAGPGRGPIPEPAPGSAPASNIPAFPGGTHWYQYGETNRNIKVFQDQMHARGYFPVGTGQYGPNTQRMVEQLQRLNGLIPNGYIGPNTWRLAWTGVYH